MQGESLLSNAQTTLFREDIFILSLLILCAVLLIASFGLFLKIKKFTKGKNGHSLEEIIKESLQKIEELEAFKSDAQAYFLNVEKRLRRSFQAIETTRFNAFKGTGSGGNQSFATAFLNENGDGVIISSMYGHDKVSVFAKPLKKCVSEYTLTEEEEKALEHAKSGCAHKNL